MQNKDQKDTYIGCIASKDQLLDWRDISLKKVQPLFLQADLLHVDISRGDCFVAAFNASILNENQAKKKDANTR